MENIKRRVAIKAPARASVWYIASSLAARVISALGTPIFTRLLTPEEYGLYPLYTSWLGIFTVVVTLEICGGAIYRGLQKSKEDKDAFISAMLGLIFVLFSVFLLAYLALGRYINALTGLGTAVTLLLLLQILANAVISLYSARARFEYRYKTVALLNVLSAGFIPIFAVSLIYLGIRAEARIIASSMTVALISIPIALVMLKRSRRLIKPNLWLHILRQSLPLMPHYFAMTMTLKVIEITVSRVYGAEAIGRFSVALSVGMAITVITGGLLSALSPWTLRRLSVGDIASIRELMLILTELISVACLGLLALAPEVMAFFAAESFHSALPAIYPIALAMIPSFIASALMNGNMYFERSVISVIPALSACGASILLSLFVLPHVDYRYAGLFLLAAYTLLASLNILVFKRLGRTSAIEIKKTVLVFLSTVLYASLFFIFRDIMLSRILLALPLVPMLWKVGTRAFDKIRE